ncbi:hypothetical protein ACRAWD_13095 [Caulobacter segnis]
MACRTQLLSLGGKVRQLARLRDLTRSGDPGSATALALAQEGRRGRGGFCRLGGLEAIGRGPAGAGPRPRSGRRGWSG